MLIKERINLVLAKLFRNKFSNEGYGETQSVFCDILGKNKTLLTFGKSDGRKDVNYGWICTDSALDKLI